MQRLHGDFFPWKLDVQAVGQRHIKEISAATVSQNIAVVCISGAKARRPISLRQFNKSIVKRC
jgi:hypothetical protein